jgi:hypothetical protein
VASQREHFREGLVARGDSRLEGYARCLFISDAVCAPIVEGDARLQLCRTPGILLAGADDPDEIDRLYLEVSKRDRVSIMGGDRSIFSGLDPAYFRSIRSAPLPGLGPAIGSFPVRRLLAASLHCRPRVARRQRRVEVGEMKRHPVCKCELGTSGVSTTSRAGGMWASFVRGDCSDAIEVPAHELVRVLCHQQILDGVEEFLSASCSATIAAPSVALGSSAGESTEARPKPLPNSASPV